MYFKHISKTLLELGHLPAVKLTFNEFMISVSIFRGHRLRAASRGTASRPQPVRVSADRFLCHVGKLLHAPMGQRYWKIKGELL